MPVFTITIPQSTGCCGSCDTSVYGESFVFDLSGIFSCGCFERPGGSGNFYYFDLPSGYSSEVTMNYIGGDTWISSTETVTLRFYNGSEDTCPDPTEVDADWTVYAYCWGAEPYVGSLRIIINMGGFTAYEGYFYALDETAPNVAICGVDTGGPFAGSFGAMQGGNGSISAPP